jgi:hypothetical protein
LLINLEVFVKTVYRKWILVVWMVSILAFSLPVMADSVPPSVSQDLNTHEPDTTLALPTGTLEPPVPPTPTDLSKPELYRQRVEPTRIPPNRAVFTVGFMLAALVVLGMIVLGYIILRGLDNSPE